MTVHISQLPASPCASLVRALCVPCACYVRKFLTVVYAAVNRLLPLVAATTPTDGEDMLGETNNANPPPVFRYFHCGTNTSFLVAVCQVANIRKWFRKPESAVGTPHVQWSEFDMEAEEEDIDTWVLRLGAAKLFPAEVKISSMMRF